MLAKGCFLRVLHATESACSAVEPVCPSRVFRPGSRRFECEARIRQETGQIALASCARRPPLEVSLEPSATRTGILRIMWHALGSSDGIQRRRPPPLTESSLRFKVLGNDVISSKRHDSPENPKDSCGYAEAGALRGKRRIYILHRSLLHRSLLHCCPLHRSCGPPRRLRHPARARYHAIYY